MGYVVYVVLTEDERPVVRRFLDELTARNIIGPGSLGDDGRAKPDDLFGEYVSGPVMEGLSCPVEDGGPPEHADGTYVGCSYGDHDIAHTFVSWMTKALGKTHYLYDGSEPMEVARGKVVHHRTPRMPYPGEEVCRRMNAKFNMDGIVTEADWEAKQDELGRQQDEDHARLERIPDTLQPIWDAVKPAAVYGNLACATCGGAIGDGGIIHMSRAVGKSVTMPGMPGSGIFCSPECHDVAYPERPPGD